MRQDWLIGGLIAASLAGGAAFVHAMPYSKLPESPADRAAYLVDLHQCWTGETPEGVQALRAVVTWPGTVQPVYAGQRAVAIARQHDQTGAWPGLVVHGYCP